MDDQQFPVTNCRENEVVVLGPKNIWDAISNGVVNINNMNATSDWPQIERGGGFLDWSPYETDVEWVCGN